MIVHWMLIKYYLCDLFIQTNYSMQGLMRLCVVCIWYYIYVYVQNLAHHSISAIKARK